jgi:tricorn protease
MFRCIAFLFLFASAYAQQSAPILARKPALSRDYIVFSFAGDLWRVPRAGGAAVRLTSGAGTETDPAFSPDGQTIAFTGEYDGNVDVYVIPVAGGVPKRLTYHPAPDRVLGWTRDGKRVLFESTRNSYARSGQLFTIGLDETLPTELPLPSAEEGSFNSDGSQIAYVPLTHAFNTWKRYRGGQATPIWIARLSDSSIQKLPRKDSNDFNPMWVGSRIYFLSDRNGPVSLFSYDPAANRVVQEVANDGLDFKSASAGPGAIVYEQFGSLHLFDLETHKSRKVEIRLAADLPEVRARWEKVSKNISAFGISPTGARAVFEARGEIFTAPAEKGDIRDLTHTPGAAERDPAWSPDGKSIAYISDETGDYQLYIASPDGLHEKRRINIGGHGFYYSPTWSPDSKKIAYTDNALNVNYVDIDQGSPVRIDTDIMDGPRRTHDLSWSPDSRWIAYTRQLQNTLRAVFVYSLESRKSIQITDGMSDAYLPVFDKDGKHLYFTASTDFGLNVGWRDMSSIQRPSTRTVYAFVLRKDLPSPLAPESDEEKPDAAKDDSKKPEKPPTVSIDSDMIEQRILALPIPARDYVQLEAGKAANLFLVESPFNAVLNPGPAGGRVVYKFDLKTRKVDKVVENITGFALSANGEKMLLRQPVPTPPSAPPGPALSTWIIASTSQPFKAGEGVLKLDEMQAWVEPRSEWKQMYEEAWRIERDFFYDPALHGLDLERTKKLYEPYLAGVGNRDDLNYLFAEMLGEITVSHLAVAGGAHAFEPKRVPGGLLGADFKLESGRWRVARVYTGESWNPGLRAPLTQPGVNVMAGEYILAVNGADLRASDNLYGRLEGTANKQVVLRVGPNAGGANSREVTVQPIASESALRRLAWVEGNRRKVSELSGGQLAYVYLPDTTQGGYVNFNRYYFAQVDKQGAVIDERFNGGGLQADYIIDYLSRQLMAFRVMRQGQDVASPLAAIFGPKAMLIDEYAGSGGDAMPFYFRKAKIGPLIGKRTWGGLVGGLGGYPALMDGGVVAAPSVGFYNPGGSWEVENVGVSPDIEVEQDPQAIRQGHDPQLEKAVAVLMEQLRQNPAKKYQRPPFPNYHPQQ